MLSRLFLKKKHHESAREDSLGPGNISDEFLPNLRFGCSKNNLTTVHRKLEANKSSFVDRKWVLGATLTGPLSGHLSAPARLTEHDHLGASGR